MYCIAARRFLSLHPPPCKRATLTTPLISLYVSPRFRKLRAAMRPFLFLSHFTIDFAEH